MIPSDIVRVSNDSHEAPRVSATRFQCVDPKAIPRRCSIYGMHYIRKYISATAAIPGIGKSSLSIVEILAIVTGRPLLGIIPTERVNVWIWNGEDPFEELQRRIVAAACFYQIDWRELEGRLFVD